MLVFGAVVMVIYVHMSMCTRHLSCLFFGGAFVLLSCLVAARLVEWPVILFSAPPSTHPCPYHHHHYTIFCSYSYTLPLSPSVCTCAALPLCIPAISIRSEERENKMAKMNCTFVWFYWFRCWLIRGGGRGGGVLASRDRGQTPPPPSLPPSTPFPSPLSLLVCLPQPALLQRFLAILRAAAYTRENGCRCMRVCEHGWHVCVCAPPSSACCVWSGGR